MVASYLHEENLTRLNGSVHKRMLTSYLHKLNLMRFGSLQTH